MADSMQVEANAAAWPSAGTEGRFDMEAIGGMPDKSAPQPVAFGTRSIACRCQFAGGAACRCVFVVPLADLCLQVEYYFSDENLATDDFFRKEVINNDGWVSIGALLRCNRIKRMGARKEYILSALVGSHLETAADGSAVRRSGNAPLPARVPPVEESAAEDQCKDSERGHADHSAPGTSQGVIFIPSGLLGCHYFQIGDACPWFSSEFPACQFGSAGASNEQVFNTEWGPATFEGPQARQSFAHAPLPAGDHNHYYNMAFHSQEQSREVQAAMDNLNNASLRELAFQFKGSVVIACKDKNAHRVVLKLIKLSPRALLQFLIDEMFSNIWHIVRNKYGCRVVRDLVNYCSNQVQTLVERILLNAADLCRHEFGRYVAQAIIENAGTEQRKKLEGYVLKNIVALCSDQETLTVMTGALSGPASAAVATCILEQEGLVVSLARSRRGSQAVTLILNLPQCHNECVRQLADQHDELTRTRYGRVVDRVIHGEAGIAASEEVDSGAASKHQVGHEFPNTENDLPTNLSSNAVKCTLHALDDLQAGCLACMRYYEAREREIAKATSLAAAAPPADAFATASSIPVGSAALMAGGGGPHPSKSERFIGEAPTLQQDEPMGPTPTADPHQVSVTTTGTTVQDYMQHWEKHMPPVKNTFVNCTEEAPLPARRIRTAPPAPKTIHEKSILAGDTTASECGDAPQWPDTDDEFGCSAMA